MRTLVAALLLVVGCSDGGGTGEAGGSGGAQAGAGGSSTGGASGSSGSGSGEAEGAPCSDPGTLGCPTGPSEALSDFSLRCAVDGWKFDQRCAAGEACYAWPGAKHGKCLRPEPACVKVGAGGRACLGGGSAVCNTAFEYTVTQTCSDCKNGLCPGAAPEGPCPDGSTRCADSKLSKCVGGEWVPAGDCKGF